MTSDIFVVTVYVQDDDGGVRTDTFKVHVQVKGRKTLPATSSTTVTTSESVSLSSPSTSSSDEPTSDDVVVSNETIAVASSLPEEEGDVADEENTEEAALETNDDSVFIEFEETLLDDLLAV
jgi:hypothetical protein